MTHTEQIARRVGQAAAAAEAVEFLGHLASERDIWASQWTTPAGEARLLARRAQRYRSQQAEALRELARAEVAAEVADAAVGEAADSAAWVAWVASTGDPVEQAAQAVAEEGKADSTTSAHPFPLPYPDPPLYQHDCPCCCYLGRYISASPGPGRCAYDLYFCRAHRYQLAGRGEASAGAPAPTRPAVTVAIGSTPLLLARYGGLSLQYLCVEATGVQSVAGQAWTHSGLVEAAERAEKAGLL